MAAIRSSGNATTELAFAALLQRGGVSGWKPHPVLAGSPDFGFSRARLAIFVDGCFWHGCSLHTKVPVNNQAYWIAKVQRTRARDRLATRKLRAKGWRVMRVWEHCLREPQAASGVMRRLVRLLSAEPTVPLTRPRRRPTHRNTG